MGLRPRISFPGLSAGHSQRTLNGQGSYQSHGLSVAIQHFLGPKQNSSQPSTNNRYTCASWIWANTPSLSPPPSKPMRSGQGPQVRASRFSHYNRSPPGCDSRERIAQRRAASTTSTSDDRHHPRIDERGRTVVCSRGSPC